MWRVALPLCLAATGCGRSHFDEVDDARVDIDTTSPDAAPDAPSCAASYTVVAGLSSRYRLISTQGTWYDAEASCESDGGHLIIPDDVPETDYLISVIAASGSTEGWWIGLSDHVTETVFRTVSGTMPTPNWNPTEPNSLNSDEDCVQALNNGKWNDNTCDSQYAAICECDLVPLAVPSTYCVTGTYDNCDVCGGSCTGTQTCTIFQMCQ